MSLKVTIRCPDCDQTLDLEMEVFPSGPQLLGTCGNCDTTWRLRGGEAIAIPASDGTDPSSGHSKPADPTPNPSPSHPAAPGHAGASPLAPPASRPAGGWRRSHSIRRADHRYSRKTHPTRRNPTLPFLYAIGGILASWSKRAGGHRGAWAAVGLTRLTAAANMVALADPIRQTPPTASPTAT